MLFARGRAHPPRLPFFYGWVAVSIGALTMFFTTPGQSDSFSIFINSFIEEFSWSRTRVSSIYSIATLLSGCLMFIVGRVIDRIGSKWTAIAAALLLGLACFINSFVTTQVVLFLGFFIARFAGKGTLELSANTVAPQWFIRKRALAIMIVSLGGTAGGVVFPLLNNYLIASFGWRSAFRTLGFGVWIIYLPVVFFFFISRPEDAGMRPDGPATPKYGEKPTTANPDEHPLKQEQAIRTAGFWILAFCVFQSSMIGTGAILHFVSIFQQAGFSATFAARIMSIKPIIGLGTSLLAGLILDRVRSPKYVLSAACAGQLTSFLMLAFINGPGTAAAYSVVAGASSTMVFYCIGILTPRLFGRKYIGGILGVITAVNVVGSAIGPIMFGSAYDLFGGYRGILILSSLFPLASGILSLFLQKPTIGHIEKPTFRTC